MAGGLDEFGLIARLFAPLTHGYGGAHGLTDDAAFITPEPGKVLVVTTDTMVAGIHFLPGTSPGRIARKLIRCNLSDLAAKGAKPFAVTLNAALPPETDQDWLTGFAQGLALDLTEFDTALIGGDTVAIPGPLCLGLTAYGWADPAATPHRSGAQAGDDIWVSGTIGDGGAGLLAAQGQLTGTGADWLRDRYDLPIPRLALGQGLAGLVHAAMDISDGLLQDLGHICRASHLGAQIRIDHIPLSEAYAATGWDRLRAAGLGDDYELLFTAAPSQADAVRQIARTSHVDITRIGRMIRGDGVNCYDGQGQLVIPAQTGWQHFRSDGPQQ